MIGRALLAALLWLSVWTVAGHLVDAVVPAADASVAALQPCLDTAPSNPDSERAWQPLHHGTGSITESLLKSQLRQPATSACGLDAGTTTLAALPRPGPDPVALAHLHTIPLLI